MIPKKKVSGKKWPKENITHFFLVLGLDYRSDSTQPREAAIFFFIISPATKTGGGVKGLASKKKDSFLTLLK